MGVRPGLTARVLDASAFYAGVPFGSPESYHTSLLVYDEVCHIKRNHGAIDALMETGRLRVVEPEEAYVRQVRGQADKSGDLPDLSEGDVSVLALCLQMRAELVTDDYAASNVASLLGIRAIPVMTRGIRDTGLWVRYCEGCSKRYERVSICPQCGNRLRKKLLKRKAPSIPLDK